MENGVVKRVVYARATAERMKRSEYKDKAGPIEADRPRFLAAQRNGRDAAEHCVRSGGDPQTVEQMIASTERGVLVTRLWYIREVEPFEKMLTGMTRDGTFYVENGRVQGGVRNFRFNESLIHMLSNVEAMSMPVRVVRRRVVRHGGSRDEGEGLQLHRSDEVLESTRQSALSIQAALAFLASRFSPEIAGN